jgi:hypothetical protein
MLVGIDVSHPDKSSDAESIGITISIIVINIVIIINIIYITIMIIINTFYLAAVCGSLDCFATQYAAEITSQKSRKVQLFHTQNLKHKN